MKVKRSKLTAWALLLGLIGGSVLCGTAEQGATTAQTTSAAPPYVRRGDEVEARYRAYRDRLQRFHEVLSARAKRDAPALFPTIEAARPKPVSHGYQILPKLVPDAPPPSERPRAKSSWYSWPWTEQLIDRDRQKLDRLEAELDRLATLTATERKAAYEKMVADYRQLSQSQRTIDAHIQYNRLWQPAIANDKPGYDRQTALHNAVLERQAILDALGAADEATFRKALSGLKGIDGEKERDAVETELREHEKTLARAIHEATDHITPPPFLHIEHPAPHRWIVHVPFYTDIEDSEFIRSFQTAVESVWRLGDCDDEFAVQLSITYISATRLYRERPECGGNGPSACLPPQKGEQLNLNAHVALFPKDGAVLTTGAISTHVTGRAIALGPHDLAPHVLAHEFGHILGFKDVYFRGYQDLGADGYQVMEVVAEPEDIMGAPGNGRVLRHHFARIIGQN